MNGLRVRLKQQLGGPAEAAALQVLLGANALLMRLRERTPEPARRTAQRFGSALWAQIGQRYPSLAGLLDGALQKARTTAVDTPSAAPQTEAPRQHVARVRGTPQDFRDVRALSRALRDPSAEVAAAAAAALATPAKGDADYECRARLLEVLENADGFFNPIVRVAALQSLRSRLVADGERADFAPVLRAVRDQDAEVSLAAIAALAELAPPATAIDALLPVMLDDSGYFLPFVQSAAGAALQRAGLLSHDAVPPRAS